jgi:hypothetical protein
LAPLLADPARRRDLARAALAKVAAEHDLPAAAGTLNDILAAVVR